jgi:hypothetical protein
VTPRGNVRPPAQSLSLTNLIIFRVFGCDAPRFVEKWITFVSRLGGPTPEVD